jgi:hypothetical protein
MERFFELFSQEDAPDASTFELLAREVGMSFAGPPLAVSHPV